MKFSLFNGVSNFEKAKKKVTSNLIDFIFSMNLTFKYPMAENLGVAIVWKNSGLTLGYSECDREGQTKNLLGVNPFV